MTTTASLPTLTGPAVRNLWIRANMLRGETVGVAVFTAILTVIADAEPIAPIMLLVGFSGIWFIYKLMKNPLTAVVLVLLAMIPVIGWIVLAGLVLLRLNWLVINGEAAAATVMIAALPYCGLLPLPMWVNVSITTGLALLLMADVYSSGYSAAAFLDVFLTVPAVVGTLVLSAVHVAGHVGGGGETTVVSKPTLPKQFQADPHGVDPTGPHIEVVKGHVRTAPDGIEQNNLSYSGPGKMMPQDAKVHVQSYLRTQADGDLGNNLSAPNHGASSPTASHGPSMHFTGATAAGVPFATSSAAGTWAILNLGAFADNPVPHLPVVTARGRSPRYHRALARFAAGELPPPRRLLSITRRRLVALDRKTFTAALSMPGVSHWDRLKMSFTHLDLDPPDRLASARLHVGALLSAEMSARPAVPESRARRLAIAGLRKLPLIMRSYGAAIALLPIALSMTTEDMNVLTDSLLSSLLRRAITFTGTSSFMFQQTLSSELQCCVTQIAPTTTFVILIGIALIVSSVFLNRLIHRRFPD